MLMDETRSALQEFMLRDWRIANDNYKSLSDQLIGTDGQIFHVNLEDTSYEEFYEETKAIEIQ